ncbi:hypothetical protein [Spirosoma montaniterrae]|uniref:Uncharacterized protein n=1 Tax=Spirosoma montaniterrae TaxID=1178516 RepID=A0A1P9WYY9_9BACT|nr:hypothetical protein [Spirosoma montaniterrae]AQG80597.1 hypothetical protein AWR27_15470 [Spirosoma montaniterrae]
MIITTTIAPIGDIIPKVQAHARKIFQYGSIPVNQVDEAVKDALALFQYGLRDDLFVCIESPYMDEVYRDSYSQYYAGKLESYPKDCIRLSFFEAPIKVSDFRDSKRRSYLQQSFMGFLVLRPTLRNVIGRNVMSPKAYWEPIGEICQTTFTTTVNCVKLTIDGFPHSAQDTETMTCAQTTLWAIMEYFSRRYPHYQLAFPSGITRLLEPIMYERMMPAVGLHISHVSYVLRSFGFGPRIYSKVDYQEDFTRLFSCYVESGIPIVVSILNKDEKTSHAVICVGRKAVDTKQLVQYLQESDIEPEQQQPPVYDLDRAVKEYVFIDDNLPPYSRAAFGNGNATLTRSDGKKFEVTAFVVPLHRNVYLEASTAKRYVENLLAQGVIELSGYHDVILKFFLTSSRSYKDRVATDPYMQSELKQVIVSAVLPQFIWVGELSTPKFFQQKRALGVVLLDATEAYTAKDKPLILVAFHDKIRNFAAAFRDEATLLVPVKPFSQYQSNLT